jgi:hypothetical protein
MQTEKKANLFVFDFDMYDHQKADKCRLIGSYNLRTGKTDLEAFRLPSHLSHGDHKLCTVETEK